MRLQTERLIIVVGLLIRVMLVVVISPPLHDKWFVVFLESFGKNLTMDPWSTWLTSGGDPQAFPYGVGMLVLGLPSALTSRFAGTEFGSIVFTLTFLVSEVVIFRVFLAANLEKLTLATWAFSPVSLFVTYVYGQTDIPVAVAILILFVLIRNQQWSWAGFVLGFAILVKLSALLFLPFFVVYAIRSPRDRAKLYVFARSLIPILLLGLAPALYSEGFRTMVFGSRETGNLLDYSIQLGASESFLMVPMVYLAFLYIFWRQGRTTSGVMSAFSISALATVVLVAPSSVGWYLWTIPAVLLLGVNPGRTAIVVLNLMQLTAAGQALVELQNVSTRFSGEIPLFGPVMNSRTSALFQSMVLLAGLLWITSFLGRAIREYDRHTISKSPFSIAIAGDSGTGKDSLTNALKNLFPTGESQVIEGDNYHLYERGAAQWSHLTHLNPIANDLAAMREDALRARQRRVIKIKQYDHKTGRFQQAHSISPGDLVVINGLHALYLNRADYVFDIGVFLEMEETLRSDLKIYRDVLERGTPEDVVRHNIARRNPDAIRYVEPQRVTADLIFRLSRAPTFLESEPRFILEVQSLRQSFLHGLTAALNSLVLVQHEIRQGDTVGELHLTVDANDLTSDDLRNLTRELIPELTEILDSELNYLPGPLGLESLIVLLAVAERRSVHVR